MSHLIQDIWMALAQKDFGVRGKKIRVLEMEED